MNKFLKKPKKLDFFVVQFRISFRERFLKINRSGKTSKKIVNWSEYNEALARRGDVTFWFSEEFLSHWTHANPGNKRGRPFIYSDQAVETHLIVRKVFHLIYRCAEGLERSMFAPLNVWNGGVSDDTLLYKRATNLDFAIKVQHKTGKLDVAVDSTGLKVYGEGEWKVRTHGKSKRRTWRKIHWRSIRKRKKFARLKSRKTASTTRRSFRSRSDQIDGEIERFLGDSGYDKRKVYRTLSTRKIQPCIPPRKNAIVDLTGSYGTVGKYRNAAIRSIQRRGSKAWKRRVGYHRRSLAETAMFRLKTLFGERLKNRKVPTQRTETAIKIKALNKMTSLGLPVYLK